MLITGAPGIKNTVIYLYRHWDCIMLLSMYVMGDWQFILLNLRLAIETNIKFINVKIEAWRPHVASEICESAVRVAVRCLNTPSNCLGQCWLIWRYRLLRYQSVCETEFYPFETFSHVFQDPINQCTSPHVVLYYLHAIVYFIYWIWCFMKKHQAFCDHWN